MFSCLHLIPLASTYTQDRGKGQTLKGPDSGRVGENPRVPVGS